MNNFELFSSESSQLTFPVKLKAILDDISSDNLIYWNDDGQSFHITDENQFAKEIIPKFFKHNNIASFIRQLNMYGFHKINRIESNSLTYANNSSEDSQWKHPYFIRDRPDLLNQICRKNTTIAKSNINIPALLSANDPLDSSVTIQATKEDINKLVQIVQSMRKRDEKTEQRVRNLELENIQLREQVMFCKDQYNKQKNLIQMVIQMFTMCQNNGSQGRVKRNLLALDLPQSNENISNSYSESTSRLYEPLRKYLVTSPSQGSNEEASNSSSLPSYQSTLTNVVPKLKIIKSTNIQKLPSSSQLNVNNISASQPPPKKIVKITNLQNYQPKKLDLNLPSTSSQLCFASTSNMSTSSLIPTVQSQKVKLPLTISRANLKNTNIPTSSKINVNVPQQLSVCKEIKGVNSNNLISLTSTPNPSHKNQNQNIIFQRTNKVNNVNNNTNNVSIDYSNIDDLLRMPSTLPSNNLSSGKVEIPVVEHFSGIRNNTNSDNDSNLLFNNELPSFYGNNRDVNIDNDNFDNLSLTSVFNRLADPDNIEGFDDLNEGNDFNQNPVIHETTSNQNLSNDLSIFYPDNMITNEPYQPIQQSSKPSPVESVHPINNNPVFPPATASKSYNLDDLLDTSDQIQNSQFMEDIDGSNLNNNNFDNYEELFLSSNDSNELLLNTPRINNSPPTLYSNINSIPNHHNNYNFNDQNSNT